MTDKQKDILKKLLIFEKNPQLAIWDMLKEISSQLELLSNKEKNADFPKIDFPKIDFPKIDFPKIPEADFTETNKLLKKILEKLEKNEDISITFKLE